MTVHYDHLSASWLGYACLRVEVEDGPTVYTDPGRYGTLDGTWAAQYGGVPHPEGPSYEPRDGDIVLVTHDHHYDDDGVRRVASDDATILVYDGVDANRASVGRSRELSTPESLPYDVRRVRYGDRMSAGGVTADVLPAYNRVDGPRVDGQGRANHPRGFGCGYRFEVDGTAVFWPGDSDVIDEHRGLDVDLFCPSIAAGATMDRHDAAELAERFDPELVLPIHFNTIPGLRADVDAFAADVAGRGIPVAVDHTWK